MPSETILEKIHKISVYILILFDKFCQENGLTYFLDSGTALGAVRHGGFIPWDDDIDVGMPRKDYERLLRLQEKLPSNLFLQSRNTDPLYKYNAAKIRLIGTIFQEKEDMPYEHNGFFIDIFPYDNIPSNRYKAKINITVAQLIFYIIRSWQSEKKSPYLFRRIITNLFIKKLSESQIERINNIYIRFCRKYENRDTGFVTCYYWGMAQYNAYIFNLNKILPVREIMFEGHPVKIMQDPDYYLRQVYGNYMILPPENERKGHHLKGKVDFGRYSEFNFIV